MWLRSQCCRRGDLPAVRGRGGRSLHREGRRAPAAADPERCGLPAPPRRRAPRPQGTSLGLGAAGRGWGGSRTTLMPSPAHQPQNILLTRSSPPGDIRIVDFGLSRRVDAVQEVREILGTPEYVGKHHGGANPAPGSAVLGPSELPPHSLQLQRSSATSPSARPPTCGKGHPRTLTPLGSTAVACVLHGRWAELLGTGRGKPHRAGDVPGVPNRHVPGALCGSGCAVPPWPCSLAQRPLSPGAWGC